MLTRRFVLHGLESTAWLWLLVAVLLAAVTCIVLLYQYERRLISRRLGYLLLGLRLAAVAAVFCTLLEPAITWTINKDRTGRVLVALDVSDSMSTADRHADRAEKLQWLRALGLIGNAASDARLDQWDEAFANDKEPEWVAPGEVSTPAEAAALAAARQQQLEDLFAMLDNMPRRELARRLFSGGTRSLESQLDTLATVERQTFAGTATTAADANVLQQMTNEPDPALRLESTDLLKGMTPQATDSDESPLAGVILFTDGRDNAATDVSRLLARVSSLPVPVYPVLIGSQQRPRDLAVAELDYPEMIYQNDSAILRASIGTAGFEGEEITVHLAGDDESGKQISRTVRAQGRLTPMQFGLDASMLGRQRYTLQVEGQPGETRDDNNQRQFVINVVDDESHVLLLDGSAGWEFRFLDNALTRDEHVHVSKVVFHQPYLGVLPEPFFPQTLSLPSLEENSTESPFARFDVVIVGDVAPFYLPEEAWEWLQRFVQNDGGTLVLTGGRNHFPLSYQSPIVGELLPVTDLQPMFVNGAAGIGPPQHRGLRMSLTPDGERYEMMQFDPDLVKNRLIWDDLPGQDFLIRGVAQPAATVLASLPDPQHSGRLEHERQNAIIAHHYVGAGQVLWIGFESTWRWRFRAGDTWHHRFWGQIVRWGSEFKAAAGNEHVRFAVERADIEAQ